MLVVALATAAILYGLAVVLFEEATR